MNLPRFGKLEPVNPRKFWLSEAADFTPWLAEPDNLAELGDTIGLDLELEAVEKDVGPFRADIVCRDTATNTVVLIENQLEKTDHNHLGQILTYAAGLDAVTIVWIANRFTDEHRAALDWLNEVTGEEINFFGLEIKLWKIGSSQPALKFNVVSQPNEWVKTSRISRAGGSGDLTPTQHLQLRYWQTFREHVRENSHILKPTKPVPSNLYIFSIGRSDVGLNAFANTVENRIGVLVELIGAHAKAHYFLLLKQKAEIEKALSFPLEWQEKPRKKSCTLIYQRRNTDLKNEAEWPDQHAWLLQSLEKIHQILSPKIKALDAADYVDGENDLLTERDRTEI